MLHTEQIFTETNLFLFFKLLLKLGKYSIGQYKQKQTASSLSPSETLKNFKDKFTSAKPLLEQINAMTVYEINIFQTLCFMYLCKNGNTPSTFKHIYNKPINKYTTRSENILLEPLCKKNFAKFKLSYCGPHLWNKSIAPNNDLLEAVMIHIFKIQLKKIIFASTNILEDF